MLPNEIRDSSNEQINLLIAEKIVGMKHLIGEAVPELRRHKNPDLSIEQQDVWEYYDSRINGGKGYYCKYCGNMPDWSCDVAVALDLLKGWCRNNKIEKFDLQWHSKDGTVIVMLDGIAIFSGPTEARAVCNCLLAAVILGGIR